MSTDSSVNSPTQTESTTTGKRLRNFLIAMVAIILGVTLLLGVRSQTTTTSLTQLDEKSTPLEVAMTNGKPSLVEFYANWCTICQKMAPDIAQLRQDYSEQVNFVMLNVDNTKWLPEMVKYQVDGIPHFVYLDKSGTTIAEAIGDQPHQIMASNLDALAKDSDLPYAQMSGKVSEFSSTQVAPVGSQNDPRSHGSQVVN